MNRPRHTMNITLSDYRDRPRCSMTDWLYQLLFYKKTNYMAWDTDTGQVRYEIGKTNEYRCGRDRKMKLLNTFGNIRVHIQFYDSAYELLIGQILTVFSWKYLLNNVDCICDSDTGEIYYMRIAPVFVF